MISFALLLGHLVGDYIVQNDLLASGKAYRACDKQMLQVVTRPVSLSLSHYSHVICAIHCVLYTLAVLAVTCPVHTFPWWFYVVIGVVHWPIDRYGLARKWMDRIGQTRFATGPCAPWSIIMVDNIFHLVTIYILALIAGVPK